MPRIDILGYYRDCEDKIGLGRTIINDGYGLDNVFEVGVEA